MILNLFRDHYRVKNFNSITKQYFPRKMLKKICFSYQINLTIGERPNTKNIESLILTRKVNLLRL